MTINSLSYTPKIHTGSGVGPYAFEFECVRDSVFVLIDDAPTTIPYTVTLNGTGPIFQGGSVLFTQSIPATSKITIARATPQNQGTDYQTYTRFPAETHEFALDKLTLLAQENATNESGGGGGGGDFLPLTGGTMAPGAAVDWQAPGLPDVGRLVFQGFLGVPSFQWAPVSGSGPIGYLWNVGGGPIMGYSTDGVLALEGRPEFSTLPDNAVALKEDVLTGGGQFVPLAGGTWDLGALMTYLNDPAAVDSSDVDFGFINFFGINALRVRAKQRNTPLGIGYLLLTDDQNEEAPYVVGSKSDGWRVRFQTFDDIDAIVTRDYLEQNTVEEAPEDGTGYARQDAGWVPVTTALDFLPLAGGTMDTNARVTWQSATNAGILSFEDILGLGTFWLRPAAVPGTDIGFLFNTGLGAGNPTLGANSTDGFEIQDQVFNSDNAILTLGEGNSRYLGDAPIDDNEYVRLNGGWAINSGGSGGEVNTNSNAGAGAGLVLPKVGADTPIKSVIGGTNITITEQADTITIAASGDVSVNWGGIGGTLSAQTDLQSALDAKADLVGGNIFTGDQTFDGQVVIDGGLAGGLIVTGSGAGFSIDATGIIFGRAGFNANNQKLTALATGTANTDAVNVLQLNNGLAGKANTSHTHTIAQVSGLQAALDGKAALSHTHVIGDVTGLQTALNSKTERAANETVSGIWTFASGFSATFGVTLSGGALMGNSRIQGLGDPVNPQDAATRAWVEANFAPL